MQGNDIYQLRQLQALQNHDPVSARARAFAKGHAERIFPKISRKEQFGAISWRK